VADGNLTAVGEARFESGAGLPFHDRDLATRLGEIPGACDAREAGADDQNFHDAL
jgi:hypothetical protein